MITEPTGIVFPFYDYLTIIIVTYFYCMTIIIKLVSTAEISTLLMHIIKAVISLSLPFSSTLLCQLLCFEVVLSHLYYEDSFLYVSGEP